MNESGILTRLNTSFKLLLGKRRIKTREELNLLSLLLNNQRLPLMLLVEDTLIIIRRVDAVALLLETSEIPISDLLVIAACNGVGHGVSLVKHRAAYARN